MPTALPKSPQGRFPPRVEALAAADMRPAYALIRLRHPDLAFAEWRRIANRALRGKSLSALAAFDGGDRLVGLCLYANVPAVGGDPSLVALSTIAVDPVNAAAVRAAMQNRLVELARGLAAQVAVATAPAPLLARR